MMPGPSSRYSATLKSGTSGSVMVAAVSTTHRLSQPFIGATDHLGETYVNRLDV